MAETVPGDEQAVSPVIGVILLIGITMVLASVVWLLATGLSRREPEVPRFFGTLNDGRDRIEVVKLDAQPRFSNYGVRGSATTPAVTGLRVAINSMPTLGTGIDVPDATTVSLTQQDYIAPGNYIGICAVGAPSQNHGVEMVAMAENQVVLQVRFSSIAQCA